MKPGDSSHLPPLAGFDYQPHTRLLFGVNTVDRVGDLARELSAKAVLLVTDRGLESAGHAQRVQRALQEAGLRLTCFDQVRENPSTHCVEQCVAVARPAAVDLIIGLGGGSSLDTAKGCNFLLTNGGHMQDYRGYGKAARPLLPLIAIPTTAGTGSECQSYAIITDARTHEKMACGDPKAAPHTAILDPGLTLSQPPRVTACSGIDALAHAIETAVTKTRTPLSLLFSHEAFKLAWTAFPRVLAQPADLEARGQMLLGAAWAGLAIENSMLGATHAAANPLTAHFNLAHGQAVGLMLPHVVRFNASDPHAAHAYLELAVAAGWAGASETPAAVAERLAKRLEELLDLAGLRRSLADCGLKRADLPYLAVEAAAQWTAQFNPRPVAAPDFEHLYAVALPIRAHTPTK